MRIHSAAKLEKLKQLRITGHTISEITTELAMPKTSVWHHVQKIQVPEKYINILRSKQGGSKNRAQVEWQAAKMRSKELLPKLDKTQRLIIATCLYWAEGNKTDFILTNTDPYLVRVFIKCLSEFGIDKNDLAISLRLFSDINIRSAKLFWAKWINIHTDQIKSVNVLPGKKNGKLPYGMCRVRVKKGRLNFKLINTLREQISTLI